MILRLKILRYGMLSPAFYLRPKFCKSAEFRVAANKDVDLFFKSIRIIGGCADIFDVFPKLFEAFSAVIEHDHAISGVPARSP